MRRPFVMIVAAALAACSGKSGGTGPVGGGPAPTGATEKYFAQVALDGGPAATLRMGALPAASGGPAVTASSDASAIPGGSKLVSLSSTSALAKVLVGVQGKANYYELATSGATSAALVLTLGQEAPAGAFTAVLVGVDASGQHGAPATVPFSVTQVGTGAIQVSVSWDAESDVDLHVVPPGGDEIYYGNSVAAGGTLDLDSNAGCDIDSVKNENITWPAGAAPSGEYIVRVDYYDACDVSATKYVVTVNVSGRPTQTFSGTFTGTGDWGDVGSGVEITRFTFP